MGGASNQMCVSDEEVFYELLQENEYSDISESEYSGKVGKIIPVQAVESLWVVRG
jgi:hypothetical protein